jgi:hypothetical protein
MSRKYPLSYPAPQSGRNRKGPRDDSRKGLFDRVFGNTFMRDWFHKISVHGITPILIGAAATASGNFNMPIRSIAMLVCATWLSIDLGIWLSGKKWKVQWKFISFTLAFCLSCCIAMSVMYRFLLSALDDQQVEVFNKLDIEVPQPESENPITTMFSARNNGGTDIGDHHISCLDKFIVFQNLNVFSGDRSSFSKQSGPLIHGGDRENIPCLESLAMFKGLGPLLCADVKIVLDYALVTQPKLARNKFARFVTRKEGNRFIWYGQPVGGSTDPCRDVLQQLVTYPVSSLPF